MIILICTKGKGCEVNQSFLKIKIKGEIIWKTYLLLTKLKPLNKLMTH